MSGPPLFRIGGSRGFESSSPAITVGTVSSCSIALRDPLASEEHCRISRADDQFQVEDLASATGTYLNGVSIAGRTTLRAGDALIVGSSRLRVESVGGSASPLLTLTLEEACFYYQASGRGGAKRDADNWVSWEVGFGRLPGLRIVGWIAGLAAACALAFPWIAPAGEKWLSAGPLTSMHALLLERTVQEIRADPRLAHLAHQAVIAQRDGCSSCHAPGGEIPMSKCVACHADKVSTRHPFGPAPIAASNISAGWDEGACVDCHAEHEGPAHANVPVLAGSAKETCVRCHTDEQRREATERLLQRTRGAPAGPVLTRMVALPASEFSHRSHLSIQDLTCDTCHGSVGERLDATAREFSPVPFEACQKCHDARPEHRSADGVHVADRLAAKALFFDVPVHGTERNGELCLECHADPGGRELRRRSVVEADLEFRVVRRPHGDAFTAHGEDCTRCHRNGARQEAASSEPFRHGLHLADLEPRTPEERAQASRACLPCHAQQSEAKTLAADRAASVRDGAQLHACGGCHERDDGTPVSLAVEPGELENTRERVGFPHDRHASVPGGCFACHVFDASDDLFRARPVTPPEVADCSACHAGHENVGRSCARCHVHLADLIRGEVELRPRPHDRSFSHRTSGHALASQQAACGPCHAGIERSEDVRTIPIPAQSDALCIDCHVEKGAVFHFGIGGR